MSENENNRKVSLENIREAELSIIFVRKKMIKIIDDLNTTRSIHFRQRKKLYKYNKFKIFRCTKQQIKSYTNKDACIHNKSSCRHCKKMDSMPILNNLQNEYSTSSSAKSWNNFLSSNPPNFSSNFIVNTLITPQYQNSEYPHLNNYSFLRPCWKVYRCQLNTKEETCCCSCNSDAMFEVMKSLYDCYKKKNCDNCNCILCGHLPREERRAGEIRKKGELSLVPMSEFMQPAYIKKLPSEKVEKLKAAGLLTPLEGKSADKKEEILRGLAMNGISLPKGKTASDIKLIDKIRKDIGLPPEPKSPSAKKKYEKAVAAGLVTPLFGKSPSEKERILKGQADLGLALPVGRTTSEQNLIAKLKGLKAPSSKLLRDKTPSEKEKIIKDLAMKGVQLPEGKTPSEKKIIEKVRTEVGLPPPPKTPLERKKYEKALASGLITPLVGKTASEKEIILKGQADLGLALPEGRTMSEKKLIAKIKSLKVPSSKLLGDKTSEEKENIIKDLAMKGMPLPEGKSASEKKLIEKVRAEVGLPPTPTTPSAKEKYDKAFAAGHILPLEGKSNSQKEKMLREQAKIGVPLPEGRTPSEKALIAKIKEEYTPDRIRRAKAGKMTPLHGKTPEQKESILRDLAMHKIPLPEGKTASEKQIINKVRKELGLPPEPKTKHEKAKFNEAIVAGLITPLEGKTQSQKEKILQAQADIGIQLPEGRTASEKSLIKRIKKTSLPPEKRKKLDEKTLKVVKEGKGPSDECICGIIAPELVYATPLQKEQKIRELAMQGIPLPEAKTASEKKLYEKVQADLGLPPVPTTPSLKEKYARAQDAGVIVPLEGKTKSQKAKILVKQAEMGIPLPEGRTPSEKSLVNKVRATVKPITGKPPEEQKKILRNMVKAGLPLPEGTTPSEKKIIKQVQDDIGIPSTGIPSELFLKAKTAGLITPLEGKSTAQKEKILRDRVATGLPLPEGVTPSDKELIKKVKESTGYKTPKYPSKIIKKKSVGLLTPLEGKTPSEKEKILEHQRAAGLPLPEGKTPSEKEIIEKVKKKKSPKMLSLHGKSPAQKEKILRHAAKHGLPLPEPKTPSEKAIIDKVKAEVKVTPEKKPLSAKMRWAKAAGLLTPLEGKTAEQKEKILRGLVKAGIPLPEGKSKSEKKIIEKIREDVGLPPEPKTLSLKEKMKQAQIDGIITPLEGKTPAEKEKILRKMHDAGIPLPKGRTSSEKSLVKKIKARPRSVKEALSEKLRKAKAAGFLTPLEGKTTEQKENILRGLAKAGVPLPEGKTSSEKKIIEKVREEVGLPPEPKTPSLREKMKQAQIDGIITPLEGKTPAEKEKILLKMHEAGIPLPKGRTASEKSLVKKVKAGIITRPYRVSSKKLRDAKAAGLLTPLEGKTPAQKERIITGLAKAGLPLPEGKTVSEKAIINKVQEKIKKIDKKSAKVLKEGKGPSDECICDMLSPMIPPKKAISMAALIGKTPEEKEKYLKDLALQGIPLPEGKTKSDKKLINKIRADIGLPPEPTTTSLKEKYDRAMDAGLITPLQGKTESQKEKILRGQVAMGLPLPEGRTPSEKDLIAKVKATTPPVPKIKSEKLRKAKAAGLLTPLRGKSPEQKEKILKGLAMHGIPLPEPTTSSERNIIDKVRAEVGLPPEPKTQEERQRYDRAVAAGIITPLQGKSPSMKEKILRGQAEMGLPLPEGRTPSEKALVAKVRATTLPLSKVHIPLKSEKLRRAKAAGILTPLKGKTPDQKEKILKGLAMHGIPLPEPTTSSERNIMDKVRAEVGLPPEPKTKQEKEIYDRAIAAGLLTPLQGKSPSQKEKILREQAGMGLPLPEGRTPSEKELIAKVRATTPPVPKIKSEKLRKAKAAGLLTPLRGKSPEQKEKILKGLAMHGIPLPEPTTSSERNIIDKVRADVGLPPEPKTKQEKETYDRAIAAGIITPLQGKSPSQKEKILREQAEMGLPLPEGRTPSEKELIAKVRATTPPVPKIKSEKLRKAKAAGLLTPLHGKSPEQKEKILKGLAMHGIPLPEPTTSSERNIIDKVRAEVGLPPEPKTRQERQRYDRAIAAGIITPLQGKSPSMKEKILRGQAEMGLPLPEGRTPSEKALVAKVRATTLPLSKVHMPLKSEKLRRAKAAGILTPLQGKTPEQKEKILKGLAMHGIPLPEAKTSSERNIIDKVRAEVGLPPEPKTKQEKEMYDRAIAAGLITPLQGKSPSQKEKILREQAELGLPLPEGRTPSEKDLIAKVKATIPPVIKIKSEKLRKAKAAGLLTPLEGKSPEQKEKILKGLAMHGIPLPEPKTSSERNIMDKVRAEVGLPPEPKTKQEKQKYDRAIAAGIITPLQGKSPSMKEKILRGQAEMGLPLPEGRTPSEKDLIAKVRATTLPLSKVHIPLKSEKLRKAKAAGILTPLQGKTPEQKEKILKGLAMHGIPLPEAKTSSERNIIDKVRAEVGLPPEPKTKQEKDMYNRAIAAGIITPLQGKSPSQKEKILREQAEMGLPLPVGRTPSEKELIAKVRATTPPVPKIKSEKLRKAKAAGLLTPLHGKSPEQKEKILKGLAMHGIPLPEPTTSSERNIIDKVRAEVGLPPEPKTQQERQRYDRAIAAGIITPLQGKSPSMKEKILRGQAEMGLPLPEGRTPSEKALVAKVRATTLPLSKVHIPLKSEKLRKAKAAGILTPLQGKSPEQKEKILKGLAMHGIPLPEAKTNSERNIIDKVRAEVGLPPEPKTKQEKDMYDRAIAAGLITPLQGKSPSQKEKILREQAELGLPLPEGRTPSEKELIAKVKATIPPVIKIKSEKLRKAKAAGLLTPLEGKSPEQKEKILKGLAMHGIPLPEPKTSSERNIMDKVRAEVGLPPEPKTKQEKQRYDRAIAAGVITPLQGKSPSQKEKILRGQAEMGISLPEGRTPSEKDLIAKVKATTLPLSKVRIPLKSEKLRKAKAAGILTPLDGKSPEQKEQILKGLAMHGIPLPEAKTSSEKKLIDKVRTEVGLPPEPKTPQEKEMYDRATAAGIITPLQGKTPSQKEKILRSQAEMGLRLPEGRTRSEKDLIAKVKATTLPVPKVKSEKLRKAKAAGLLTPLEGKSPEQKEKILKGLAMHGIPLPEPKTSSERNIMNKVRAEVGLPPEPKTRREKEKYNKGLSAGIITPLQGKSPSQKEKILRAQAKLGLPLPEGRTPSEKSLIKKVKQTTPVEPEFPTMPPEELAKLDKKTAKVMKEGKGPSDECICPILSPRRPSLSKKSTEIFKIPSEKLRKAKEAGLLTPLEGKSPAQKEKIIKGLALQGIPLPEPKTDSERKLIDKVRTDLGLPPEPKTKSAKKVYNKALADGFITPLQGKSPAQKEKILRKQAELGILLPEGRTPSEKSLIAKVKKTGPPPLETPSLREKLSKARAAGLLTPLEGKTLEQKEKILKSLAEAGLPLPEGKTASEKSLIQKVETEYGKLAKVKTKSKKVGEAALRKKGGITEEFEDIIKTTTCDRGCGCDKKKIRFKHSYVKIRVTSPDISSLCPCPEECVPGVKGGVFTDNEGIKVTVGRVTGVPSFSSKKIFEGDHTYFESSNNTTLWEKKNIDDENSVHTYHHPKTYKNTNITCSKSETKINVQKLYTKQCCSRNYKTCSSYNSIDILKNYGKNSTSAEISQSLKKNLKSLNSSQECFITKTSNNSSLESVYLLNKYSSVSLLTLPTSISIISFSTTESSNSSFYKDKLSYTRLNLSECLKSTNNFSTSDARDNSSDSNDCFSNTYSKIRTHENDIKHNILTFRINGSNTCYLMETNLGKNESAILHKSNNLDIHDVIYDILSRRPLNNTSSLVIVMSTTSDEHSSKYSLDDREQCSTIGIDLLENHNNWNYKANSLHRLSNEKYIYSQNNNTIRQPRVIATHSNHEMPNQIRFCKIPPSNDRTKGSYPSAPNCESKKTPSNNVTSDTIFKTCDCSPDKLMELFEKSRKEMLPKTGHSRSEEDALECNKCRSNKLPEAITSYGKKVKNLCPCEQQKIFIENDIADKIDNQKSTSSKDRCKCKEQKHLNKNIICECPEPEPEIDFIDWIDENHERKLKSDLTQRISGFKINKPRKKTDWDNWELEMSFEQTLRYIAENLENESNNYNSGICSCKSDLKFQSKKGPTDCECSQKTYTPEAQEEKTFEEEPFTGIKFHISGKGSGSKGLNGILCFQLLNSLSKQIPIKEYTEL